MNPTDDRSLLAAWRSRRDEAAFRTICERHASLVGATCRRLGSPDADEAAQAVFIVVAQRPVSAGNSNCLAGWLVVTTRLVVAHQRRALARRRRHEQEAALETARAQVVTSGSTWDEARPLLDEALATLSTARREALVRFYLEGKSQERVASDLGCSAHAVKTRVHEGLEKLRIFFLRRGVTLGAAAIISDLAGEVASAEPSLASACAQAGLAPTTVPGAAALAHGTITTMYIKTALLAACALLVVGSSLTAVVMLGAEPQSTKPAAPNQHSALGAESNPAPPAVANGIVTFRGDDALEAFVALAQRGGPRVVVLGESRKLKVPVAMRFATVTGRALVEAVAVSYRLQIVWLRGDTVAVLQRGAPDARMEQVLAGLKSPEAVTRNHAAWLGGWTSDVRVMEPLLIASADPDPDVREEAARSIYRIGACEAVAAIAGDKALEFLEKMFVLGRPNDYGGLREAASIALGSVGSERAWAWIEKALADQDDGVRGCGVLALGSMGGERALGLLDKAVTDPNARVRDCAARALERVGGEQVVPILEKLLDPAAQASGLVAQAAPLLALGSVGGDKALALLEKALAIPPEYPLRAGVVGALGRVGGERALTLIEKEIDGPNRLMRAGAARALGSIDGEKSLLFLERALADDYVEVRQNAASALGNLGGEKALQLLGRALADEDAYDRVRGAAVLALGSVGGEQALKLLVETLGDPRPAMQWKAVSALASMGGGSLFMEQEFGLLVKILFDPNSSRTLRNGAVLAVGSLGGEGAQAVIEQAFADPDISLRMSAIRALENLGGERTLRFLERALADPEDVVRRIVVDVLGNMGGEQALKLLVMTLAAQDDNSNQAWISLHRTFSRPWWQLTDQARALLLKDLAAEQDPQKFEKLSATLSKYYPDDPVVEQALKAVKAPKPAMSDF